MLIQRLRQDKIEAMRDHDVVKKNLLSVLIGDACNKVKEPEDKQVIEVINQFIKKARENIVICKKS